LPWAFLLAETLTGLRQSEEWFWKTEPRVVIALIDAHNKIERERMKAQGAYIACCVYGKDPNELEPEEVKEEKMPGRDKPLDPSLLGAFYGR
jgi:hypothetical protein